MNSFYRYSVQWWTGQCYGVDKIHENRKHVAATTDVSINTLCIQGHLYPKGTRSYRPKGLS